MKKFTTFLLIFIAVVTLAVFFYSFSYNLASASSSKDEKVIDVTWDECVDIYDVFICAQLEDTLYKQSGETFNHTKPSEAELPSYEENPYFWDCVEDYKEEYDKSESISRDLCKDLLK